jgi:uncharacterized protein YehS (DUF1456 family)
MGLAEGAEAAEAAAEAVGTADPGGSGEGALVAVGCAACWLGLSLQATTLIPATAATAATANVSLVMGQRYICRCPTSRVRSVNPPMTNNDILRRIRYVFDFADEKMISVFGLADHVVTRAEVSDWLKQDDTPTFQVCTDRDLATFLNGLIIDKRGKSDGPAREPEDKLTNNIILTKLKIALSLKSDDMIEILGLAEFTVSKHELTALSRRPGHKHFRECQDQLLRNFLKGLQLKHRPSDATPVPSDATADPSDATADPSDATPVPSDATADPSDAAAD